MQRLLIPFLIMTSLPLMGQNGQASTTKKMFSRTTSIFLDIEANQSIIWSLLTNAEDYPRWNSTIVSLEGTIAQGEKIQLVSTLDPKRTFKLKVKSIQAEKSLVWGDAMGQRTYTLEPQANGIVRFSMVEKIGGPLFPLFAGMIPSFDESFEQFAGDLKKEAENIQQGN